MIPFCRSRTLTFTGDGFLPNTRVYAFFDRQNVNAYITPTSSAYSDAATPVAGSNLNTDGAGRISGTFVIPDPKVKGNPKFQTGEVSFKLTSSSTNNTKESPITSGETLYQAKGILETFYFPNHSDSGMSQIHIQ